MAEKNVFLLISYHLGDVFAARFNRKRKKETNFRPKLCFGQSRIKDARRIRQIEYCICTGATET